jgi:acyl-CoA dehydrogenase
MEWAAEHGFEQIHEAFQGLNANINVPVLGGILRGPIALWSRLNRLGKRPSDRLGSRIARAIQIPGPLRDRLTDGIYIPTGSNEHLATLEKALVLHHAADEVAHKIKTAVRTGALPKARPEHLIVKALAASVITREEAKLLTDAEEARHEAITVDSFSLEEYFQTATQQNSSVASQH